MKVPSPSTKSTIFLFLVFPLFLLFSFSNDEPGVLHMILTKMKSFHAERPQEKLYLHFDKTFYAAGENMWFKAYLVEASMHRLDSQSRVVYVELIDNSKTILQRQVLYVADGVTYGDFQLSDSLQQGKYLVRAYTNYMKNADEDFFFLKEFSILRSSFDKESTGEDIDNLIGDSFDPDSIDLQFFPEGGNLVACGSANRLAFKALSPDGKSIAIEGEILDDKNSVITTFQTRHEGMGLIRFNPGAGQSYFARITKPYRVNRIFNLPRVHEKGYVMQVDEIGKNVKLVVFTNVDQPPSGKLAINIVVQSRGNVYHALQGFITNNAFFTFIPRSKFPDGISQITLFDSEGKPLAERLIYQDHHESISVTLKTDAKQYEKRKRVTVYADALYRNGTPAKGNFSMTVYDEGLLNSTEKYPLTINNYLSLTADLKGRIENPGYYFKDSLSETKKNLDLLMMVHGWRRFTWKDVLEENRPVIKYNREQGIPISGRVLKAGGKKPPAGSNLKIMTMTGNAVITKPDSLGRFYTDALLYYDTMDLVIQTENEKGKKQPYKFLIDPFNTPPPSRYSLTSFKLFEASNYLRQQSQQMAVYKTSEVTVLQDVVIVEKKERDTRLVGFSGDAVIQVKDNGSGYSSIFQMLQSKVAGVIVSGYPPNMSVTVRGKEPAFLMNGMLSSSEMVAMMSPSDVEVIEVIKGGAAMYGANSVINIVLKSGAWDRVPIGVNQARYPGFYQAREFYSPLYDIPDDRHNLPDRRTTLYWEPMVETDTHGRAGVIFYTADGASQYRIVIEGITPDGYPGTGTLTFDVK